METGVAAANLKKAASRKKFQGAWEVIRTELLAHFEAEGMPKEVTEWYKRVSVDALYGTRTIPEVKYSCRRIWITMSPVVNSTAVYL